MTLRNSDNDDDGDVLSKVFFLEMFTCFSPYIAYNK